MGVQDLPMPLIDGGDIIVDGFQGVIVTAPTNTQRQQYRKLAEAEAELTRDLEGLAAAPASRPMVIERGFGSTPDYFLMSRGRWNAAPRAWACIALKSTI